MVPFFVARSYALVAAATVGVLQGEVARGVMVGDAVIGGVLARLMLGDAPETALRAGQELAAVSCGHYGAFGYGENLDDRWAAATA